MKISVDTKEDSHDDIKKVIRMLQNIVGDSQEVFSNQPLDSNANTASPFANIFGDASNASALSESAPASSNQETASSSTEETTESTEDLFAELFSEEELKKMEPVKEPEDEDEELKSKSKSKRPDIELY